MNESKPPFRRGRTRTAPDAAADLNPYRDAPEAAATTQLPPPPTVEGGGNDGLSGESAERAVRPRRTRTPRASAEAVSDTPAALPPVEPANRPDETERAEPAPREARKPRQPRAARGEPRSDAVEAEGPRGERAPGERASAEAAAPSERPEPREVRETREPRESASGVTERVERPEIHVESSLERLERMQRMERVERGERADRPLRESRDAGRDTRGENGARPDRGEFRGESRDPRDRDPRDRDPRDRDPRDLRNDGRNGARGEYRGDAAVRPERDAIDRSDRPERGERTDRVDRGGDRGPRGRHERGGRPERGPRVDRGDRPERGVVDRGPERVDPLNDRNGDRNLRRNGRRGRNRFRRGGPGEPVVERAERVERGSPPTPSVIDGTMTGWFDSSRDGGFLRRPFNSYLPDPGDPFISPALVRQHQLRRGDKIEATYGRDHRGRSVVVEIQSLNEGSPVIIEKRPEFNTLTASYPDRKLKLETGRPAKTGPELTRRAIDLIAPIGYGQRALIVAPARAGKTTLLQAIVEGVAINHPEAILIVLLVDERPEEVSEMVTWGYGEVVASSFDMPPKRHVEVADMALERARRQVELGKDVVIVLDSITRLARAHNTVDRGTGRTMSGGLDATAMQKPKAFFGSARMIAPEHGGGSLTIIATALVETGSRMDDVIFEEFKGTGNCEIKLDRSLADRRIFPAFDIATSGTRREEKLYRPDQLEKVHLLRRGLHQLPPQASMEWLIKRIAATQNNDSLLDGL